MQLTMFDTPAVNAESSSSGKTFPASSPPKTTPSDASSLHWWEQTPPLVPPATGFSKRWKRNKDGGKYFCWPNAGMVAGPRRTAAWRVLDAQYFGLAQRRERVFVVSSSGDGPDPSAILFEPEGVRRHSPPSRDAREAVAGSLTGGASDGGGWRIGGDEGAANHIIAAFGGNNTAGPIEIASALRAKGGTGHGDFESETFVAEIAGTLGSNGKAAGTATSQDATDGRGDGTPLVFHSIHQNQRGEITTSETAGALKTGGGKPGQGYAAVYSFKPSHYTRNKDGAPSDIVPPLTKETDKGDQDPVLFTRSGVRRLLPVECEALQGMPRNWTLVPYRGGQAKDGPRYKAIGNSWAVNVARWIGKRIDAAMNAGK